MTISTESTRVEYDGDGGTKPFAVPFKFLDKVDLVVLLRDKAAGTDVVQTLTTHYTATGAGAASGTVTFVTAPPTGQRVVIYNDPALTQLVDYQSGDTFPAETHEQALDRLTLQQKRTRELVERAPRLLEGDLNDGTGTFDANLNRIKNLGAPVDLTDAATKTYVAAEINNAGLSIPTGLIATGSSTSRSLADRWGEVKNVKDYGAVGDGVTDDTAAIQAAVDAAYTARVTSNAIGGQGMASLPSVYFPSGKYFLGSSVTLTSYVSIIGEWAVLTSSGLSRYFTAPNTGGSTHCYRAKFSGLVFQGGADYVYLDSNNVGGGTVLFEWCRFDEATNEAVRVKCQSSMVEFNFCYWYKNKHELYIEACDWCEVSHSTIKRGALSANGDAGIVNYGRLVMRDVFGNPNANTGTPKETAWINNYYSAALVTGGGRSGIVELHTVRFGGETGLSAAVNNYASASTVSSPSTVQTGIVAFDCEFNPSNSQVVNVAGLITATSGSESVTGAGTSFLTELSPGCRLMTQAAADIGLVHSVQSDTAATIVTAALASVSAQPGAVINNLAVRLFDVPNYVRLCGCSGTVNGAMVGFAQGVQPSAKITSANEDVISIEVDSSRMSASGGTGGNVFFNPGDSVAPGLLRYSTRGLIFEDTAVTTWVGLGRNLSTFHNNGASNNTAIRLPAASPGERYTVARQSATHVTRAFPRPLDTIRGATSAGKYLQIDVDGVGVTLACMVTGVWEVHAVHNSGYGLGYSFEDGGTAVSGTITLGSGDATPSVSGGKTFITAGSTAITDFDDGIDGQTITVRAHGAITLTDSANLQLDGNADFVMALDDTVTLANIGGTNWYETGRTVSAQTVFTGSATWNPVNVPAFQVRSVSVSCPGATVGMFVKCSLSSLDDGANQFTVHISGFVESGGGSVRVSLTNMKSAIVLIPSGTVKVSASAT